VPIFSKPVLSRPVGRLVPELLALKPANLFEQPAILHAQPRRAPPSACSFVSECGEDPTQVLQPIEQLLTVGPFG
jgi:hypothetical protein